MSSAQLNSLDDAGAGSAPPSPPEALLAWYLLSLANEKLEEDKQLEISDCLKKKAKSDLQKLQKLNPSCEAQTDLHIENVKCHLSKYYQGT